ncbi:MAG: oligosaccharide flippase family protein [Nocardioides marinisabuli]|uniref:lipopolysaccharide biosynthesis protein n=1 Tax=Nocardioides marinisabuli TaxID=419476 RepID=UPI00321B1091
MMVMTGRLIGIASSFAVSIALTRFLDPNEVGLYLLAYSVVFVLAAVGRLGFQQTVVRQVASSLAADNPTAANRSAWVAAEVTMLTSGLIALAVCAFGGPLFQHLFDTPSLTTAALAIGIWTFSESVRTVGAEAHRGFHDIRSATLFGEGPRNLLLLGSMSLGLSLTLINDARGAILVAAITGLAMAAASLGSLALRTWPRPNRMAGASGQRHRDALVDSLPLALGGLATVVLAQADLIIVGALKDSSSVAIYGLALRVATLVGLPALVLASITAPRIAHLHTLDKKDELEKLLRIIATAATLPVAAILLIFMAAGGPILSLMFGSSYEAGWLPLVILSAGCVVNVAMGLSAITLAMTGHQRDVALVSVFSITLMLGGSYIAGVLAGISMIAAAAAGAVVVQNVAMTYLCWRRLGILTITQILPRQVFKDLQSVRSIWVSN